MARHRVPLAALLAQPDPKPALFYLDALDHPAERGADAGEEIDHQPDERPIAQPWSCNSSPLA
jgi:hypothetical protein